MFCSGRVSMLLLSLAVVLAPKHAHAFTIARPALPQTRLYADAWESSSAANGGAGGGSGTGHIEQVEFKIFPDGRVEETVRGVKGSNCEKVTEKINEALGEVVASQPTEEMFEQKVEVSETLFQTESSEWDGSSSW